MERIKALIDKLKQQAEQEADAAQMMMTVQAIQAALQQFQSQRGRSLGTSKVAVMFPASGQRPLAAAPVEVEKEREKEKIRVTFMDEPVEKIAPEPVAPPVYAYDPILEIPTLTHQKTAQEINEVLAGKSTSLNERLKEQKTEVGETLVGESVQDLRKAIGINDRFSFIMELFRGDEAMYERSLKTINNFNAFYEAESWISRELEIKLGWDSQQDSVQHFYQLVKRRFSGK